ncbi:sensor histidine kinase [Pseudonocardia sp. CA-142604]|uniref:sensor histidine kinase n=1 Tax=Pseudonocardia sp. CA-142604 TaxID=3240024 RepID=UPI003D8DE8C2
MAGALNESEWRWRAQDVAIAVGGCALDLIGFSRVLAGPDVFPAWVAAYAAVGCVALLWRRRWPLGVFAVMWLHSAIASVAIPSYGPVVALMIALYTVANLAPRRAGLWALALTFLPTGFQAAAEVAGAPPEMAITALAASFTFLTLVNTGAWAVGRWARAHREQLELLDDQRRRTALEAVALERTRIAQDLHDVISHSVGVMMLQAAGARQVLAGGKIDRAAQALADIEGAGSQAMTELRRMLSVLRVHQPADADNAEGPADGTRPMPGLHEMDALVDGILAAGVPARLVTHGEPRDLDPGADLSAYRIVQESLTNVMKHAGPGVPTRVELSWSEGALELSITNEAPMRPPARKPGGGHGLIGLRERTAAVGGHLDATAQPGGGFRVTATLPTAVTSGAGQRS